MTLLERLKRAPNLLAALHAEGRKRDAPLGFVAIDSDTGRGAWFHARRFYRNRRSPDGYRIVPMEKLELKPLLKQESSGYFVAILKHIERNVSSNDVAAMFDAGLLDRVFWLTLELADDGDISVIEESTGARRPVPVPDLIQPLESATLTVGATTYSCTLPAELQIESPRDRCYLEIRCDVPRLERVDQQFVVRKKKGVIGKTIVVVDVEPRPGSYDRLSVRAIDSKSIEVRQSMVGPEQPGPPLALHVLFDRTTTDAESWTDAVLETRDAGGGNPLSGKSRLAPAEWNAGLRRGSAEAVGEAVAGSSRSIELELWPFADVAGDAMPGNLLTVSGGTGWTHVHCRTAQDFADAIDRQDLCGWRYGLDFVDAVGEVLSEVGTFVKRNGAWQHAVLIVGDSPPRPERVGDPLWEAIVARRRHNCRRSPHFMHAMTSLRAARVPVLWAYVRTRPTDSDHEELIERLNRIRERVVAALRGIDGLVVSMCDAQDLKSTVSALVRPIVERDQRFGPPDSITVLKGVFHEVD